MSGEKSLDARMAVVEEILKRVEGKLDQALNELDTKASKASVAEAHLKIDKVREKVWYATGAAAVLSFLAGLLGKDLFTSTK